MRKFISQPSVRWSVEAGRGWEQKKQELWSQVWQLQIPQGFNCLQIYRPITAENCLLAESSSASGPRGLLANAVCEPLYISSAMFPKSVVLKWWERMEKGDSCLDYNDNEIHRNQISSKHANISAGACLSSRARFVWFLQRFFFLTSLFLLFSRNVFIMCLLWRLLHACQRSGAGGTRPVNPKSCCCFSHPSNLQKKTQSLPLPLSWQTKH